jgi:hypothetical protein
MTTPTLPPPEKLERTCKGIAALDAILCEDGSLRYYSFDGAWGATRGARLASMRDGSGDEWFLVFDPAGVFFKASWHEAPPLASVHEGVPAALQAYVDEPAFSASLATYGGWFDGTRWVLHGQIGFLAEQLEMLAGSAETYQAHARDYFEVDLPLEAVAHVLAGNPIDAGVLTELGSNRTMADIAADLKHIGY